MSNKFKDLKRLIIFTLNAVSISNGTLEQNLWSLNLQNYNNSSNMVVLSKFKTNLEVLT